MRQKLSQTIPLRFPEAPVVLHTSIFREEIVLRTLAAVCAVLVISYIALVSMTIVNVIARKEALERITETRTDISQLEHEFFSRMEALTLAHAESRGLSPVSLKRYVERLTAVGVAERASRNDI